MIDIKIGSVPSLGAKEQKIETLEGQGKFTAMLKDSIKELNHSQKTSEKAMTDIATGQVKDLHQAALKIDKAELNMKFMLEVRNKALSAYKEISRIQM
jgi:flagellar hook-basal body complex protein FliE